MNARTIAARPPAPAPRGFFRRHMAVVGGWVCFALALYYALALVSTDTQDPSWNMASMQAVHNWAGSPGAFLSDIFLQFIGLAALLPFCVLIAWGYRLVSRQRIQFWGFRLAVFLAALPLAAALLALPESPAFWPYAHGLGGSVGSLMRDKFLAVLPVWAFALSSSVLVLVALWFTFAITLGEWGELLQRCCNGVGYCARLVSGRRNEEEAEEEEYVEEDEEEYVEENWWQRLRSRFRREEEGSDEEEEETSDEEEEEESEEAPAPRARPAKKPAKEKAKTQGALGLRASNKLRKGEYVFPPIALLSPAPKSKKTGLSQNALDQNARLLESVLKDFGVNGEITHIRPGPVVTLYELEPAAGTKTSRVIGLADDIARSMSAVSARIAVIPGKNAIGIELPNSHRETVYLREMIEDESFAATETKLPLALGKDISGGGVIVDLAKMPHLLVAGTTGSGKSVAINTMILSLLYHLPPDQCKFIMIDPKMLELSVYDNIPHLLSPVVTEPGKAVVALKWTVREMENRYRLMAQQGVRNVEGYNKVIREAAEAGKALTRSVQTGFDPETGRPIIEEIALDMNPLPFIVVIVDEMADLMLVAGKEIEGSIQRLAQMARAAGIHIIMATQRPSVDVITGVIKANFPTRISFQVTSRIDSRTILGEQGAEQLLGQGDMLYMAGGGRITRVHGPFVSDKEVEEVVAHLRTQGQPSYIEDITAEEEEDGASSSTGGEEGEEGALYQQAVSIVLRDRKASTSYIQRHLKIGYNRAARLIDRMEEEGIVGPANHVGKREVLNR